MKNQAKQHLLRITPYQPGRPVEEVQRELGLKSVVKLASNENPCAPSPKVLRAMRRAAAEVNRYPDSGCYHLRQALGRKWRIKPSQIIFGNGSDEIIVMAIRAFVGEGDEVIVAKPSFLIYTIASRVEGGKVVSVPLQDMRYDLPAMLKAITPRTKIIFIGNPDNPAGTYISEDPLREFLAKVPQDILVFVDEAYFEFATGRDYPRSVRLLGTYRNILVSRTFSKMYGLAGLRIGYGMAQEELAEILNRVRDPFNVNSVAQAAALACLEDKQYYSDLAREFAGQKTFLYKELKRLKVKFFKSATNFILLDLERPASGAVRALLEKGVIVRDMTAWGMSSFVRVSVGKEKENKKFLTALRQILN